MTDGCVECQKRKDKQRKRESNAITAVILLLILPMGGFFYYYFNVPYEALFGLFIILGIISIATIIPLLLSVEGEY